MAFLDETGLAYFWNQIIARLNKFVPAEAGKGLSSNDYTTEEKTKLANIEDGANKTIVDTALSSTSTNPVQNKVINTKLSTMQSDIDSKADADHAHSELVNGNASIALNMNMGGNTYDLSPQYITTYLPENSSTVYSYLGTSSNKWDYVYAKNINLNGTDLQSTLDSKVPSTRTVNGKALTANIALTASDVGALPSTTQIPSIDGLATETYVDNKVAGLVDSAPAALDTLNELAAALGDDPNFATTVATQIGTKVDKVDGKGLSTNDYTTDEKTKLAGIAAGAQVNQNAFSNITIGSTTVSADNVTDTLTLVAGDNVTLTPDATNDKITIAAIDTVYTHPTYTARTGVPTANQTPAFGDTFSISQPVSDATGHITAINTRTVTIPSGTASTTTNGLMSASDKSKLNGIATGANNYVLPVATSSDLGGVKSGTDITIDSSGNVSVNDDSHNHVISNVDGLQSALDGKADVANGTYAVTTAGDGAAYTATVPSITSLTAGVSFIMIPHTVSTTTSPTLNVNGLGAKYIRRRLTSIVTAAQAGYTNSWLASGYPFRVVYDGSQWIAEGHDKPAAADLYGTPAAATKATQDSDGQQINSTYIKGLSISDNVVTYTKGDGTTGAITLPSTTPTLNEDGVLVF